jgi:hypothetical protein
MIIVGASGRIGERYKAVLNHLGRKFYSYDAQFKPARFKKETAILASDLKAKSMVKPVLIATPSRTHYAVLEKFYKLGYREFLIEKPMFTEVAQYAAAECLKGVDIRGIANYKWIDGKQGVTEYDHFDAGKESPEWNLFQIIALARGELILKSESPTWQCTLNGRKLSLEEVHQSYITQMDKFFKNREDCLGLGEAETWFFRVKRYMQTRYVLESKPDLAPKGSPAKSSKK